MRIATVRILESERLEALSVRRLAKEVKVAPANFYNHYGSLHDLLLEIAVEYFQIFRRQIAHINRTCANRTDALKRIVFYCVDFGCTHPQLYRLMFGYIPDAYAYPRYRIVVGAAFEDLMELIYGKRVFTLTDDFGPNDMETLSRKVQAGYGMYAMLCGLSNLFVIKAPTGPLFDGDNPRESMAAFLGDILDAFIRGDLARALDAKPDEEESSPKD
ncbi:TetR family transcriptional regulator [Komagataeibacter xylinus]|uniref:TetR family transcriptional regulator n=1 Tax=Komagataeibacter xylinus TaxID=28448 RepID=A0A318PIY8_KOMXY|nr:TetR/AcrR family transcriptional regulator [Komagataeibacter xylinus]AZV37912.1 TetR/AcrR family transcriptional regulator [Komagataeibacter xylinus]PYD56838.1 TetR family transcriptional regulator [Komagataeibacter xylinus]